jgi:hypothetical protein
LRLDVDHAPPAGKRDSFTGHASIPSSQPSCKAHTRANVALRRARTSSSAQG